MIRTETVAVVATGEVGLSKKYFFFEKLFVMFFWSPLIVVLLICSTGLLASDAGQKDVENVTISGTNGTANEVKHSVGNPSGSGGAMEGEELEEIKRLQKERRPRRCHTRSASLGEKAGVGSDNLRRPTIIADPSLLKDLKKFDTSLLSYPSKCLYRTPEEYKDIYPLPQRSYQLKPVPSVGMQVIGVRRPGEKREAVADAKKSGAAKTSPPAPNGSQPVGQGAPTWMGGNLLEKAELARLEAEVEVESRELDQLREEIRRLGRAGQREEAKRQGLRARDHLALLEQSLSKERGTLSQLLSQPRALMARSRSPLPPWPFALNVPAFEVDPALLNNLKKFDTTMLNYPSKCLYKMAPPYDPYYKRPPYVTVL